MCENKYVSKSFCTISTLTIIIFSVLILLNMIFSLLAPDEFETFKEVELTDYTKLINYDFLMDIDFGPDLIKTSDYGSIGTIKDICYLGYCYINYNKTLTYNCSLACLNSLEICFKNENKCEMQKCQTTSSSFREKDSACHEFNRISKWRDTQTVKNIVEYDVNRYAHIIPKNGTCKEGYKKCGKINENQDYLCLKEDENYGCPINDIIIKSDNQSLGSYYRSFQLGNKYIFISNNKTDNYLITNLAISLDTETNKKNYEIIDKDYYSNLLIYNPYISYDSSKKPVLVYLNAVQFKLNYTYEDMLKYQEIYKEKNKIYTKEKIEELNLEVEKYKTALKGIGIAAFSSHFIISFYFLFFYIAGYACGNKCPCNCILCYDITPMKRLVHFYLAYFSQIVFSFLSFSFTIVKKITYNNILSMEYINEYRNSESSSSRNKESNDYLSSSILSNNAQFIVLLMSVIIIVLYPILIIFTPPNNYYENSVVKSNKYKTKKNKIKNNYISNELTPYQNNSNNNIIYDSTPTRISNNYSKPFLPTQTPVDDCQAPPPTNNQIYNYP